MFLARWVGFSVGVLALFACGASSTRRESAGGGAGTASDAAGQAAGGRAGRGGTSSDGGVSASGGAFASSGASSSGSAGGATGGANGGREANAATQSHGGASVGGAAGRTTNGGTGSAAASGMNQAGSVASAGAAGDACDAGLPTPDARCLPAEEPSAQTIYFDVKNTRTSEIYVVTSGSRCTPAPVRAASANVDVIQSLVEGDCPCGFACDYAAQSSVEKLGPGETVTLTWDGRELKLGWSMVVNPCDTSGQSVISELVSVPRRVPPGDYSVTIGYDLAPLCDSCGAGPADGEIPSACVADHHQSALFVLPPEGDVRVPIEIGDAAAGQ